MKRKIILSIALVSSLALVSLTSSDSTKAQNQISIVGDTGMIKLGANQTFQIEADGKFGPQTQVAVVRFRRFDYMQTVCNGGICKYAVASQTTSNPITLTAGEAAFFDVPAELQTVRVAVLSNSRDVRVNY